MAAQSFGSGVVPPGVVISKMVMPDNSATGARWKRRPPLASASAGVSACGGLFQPSSLNSLRKSKFSKCWRVAVGLSGMAMNQRSPSEQIICGGGGGAEFELGAAAEKWAQKILHPPSRL